VPQQSVTVQPLAEVVTIAGAPENVASVPANTQTQPESQSQAALSSYFNEGVLGDPFSNTNYLQLLSGTSVNQLATLSDLEPPTVPAAPSALDTAANLNGGWYSPAFLQEEVALGQAQGNYQWVEAQITAWQAAQAAGICGNTCDQALTQLQSELPNDEQSVQQIQSVIDAGPQNPTVAQTTLTPQETTASLPTPTPENSAPSGGQPIASVQANPGSAVETTAPSQPAPGSTANAPTLNTEVNAQAVVASTSTQQQQSGPPSAPGITQALSLLWSSVVQLFSTPATTTPNVPVASSTAASSTAPAAQSCSLIGSLFGGCQGW
jgi:hypothetical protein